MSEKKYPTTERGWESLMRHPVPRTSRRRQQIRRDPLKPPKCDTCGYWLSPAFDHSNCG